MPGALRIGVNALFLIPGGVGGTEIYLRNLLAALAQIDRDNQYFVFLNAETRDARPALAPEAPNFRAVPCRVRAVRRPARLLWEQVCLPAQISSRRLDVLFSPGFTSPLVAPGCAKVTVIHDLQHVRRPQNFGRIELAAWRLLVWISARFSSRIVTVSENSRRDILEVYGLAPEHVTVIRHGVERAFFDLPSNDSLARPIEAPYLLSVSTVHPHKNWARWLDAYQQLVREGRPHHLVIAGLAGNYSRELASLVEAKGLESRVHLAGWVSRGALLALFKHADALVFPSTFEGFGMPVAEAMAAGVPVACSDIAPLREAADDAALLFDPNSAASIAAAVGRLLDDDELRRRLIERGRRSAAASTWPRAAAETLAVLQRAAGDDADNPRE